jgi:hypothetical protein
VELMQPICSPFRLCRSRRTKYEHNIQHRLYQPAYAFHSFNDIENAHSPDSSLAQPLLAAYPLGHGTFLISSYILAECPPPYIRSGRNTCLLKTQIQVFSKTVFFHTPDGRQGH